MNEAHIASRMTARHSLLFTLQSGQSGIGIYTSQRDAAGRDVALLRVEIAKIHSGLKRGSSLAAKGRDRARYRVVIC